MRPSSSLRRFNHASFHLRGIDEFMRGTGGLREYTTEVEVIDEDTWHPHIYDLTDPETSDQWGTANEHDESIAAAQANDVDKSLFIAPPV